MKRPSVWHAFGPEVRRQDRLIEHQHLLEELRGRPPANRAERRLAARVARRRRVPS